MVRSKRSHATHDKKVRQEVNKLKKQGFDVSADLPGFPQPKVIGGYRPDIIAQKGKQRKIIEVETSDSKDNARDKGQQKAFRQAANRSDNTTFRRTISDK
jgi:hypothetical protein